MANKALLQGPSHLCVLVHGLWGTPAHLANVAKTLREKHSDAKLCILIAKGNSGSFTYDGIELGGERLCHEIEEELERLENEGREIKKLSVVGYSLGGLIARYAIGLLDSRGVFDKVEPVNFTTFASPHLGVRTPLRSWRSQLWNILGSRTISISGQQIFLIDDFRETGRPLLAILADPNSIFVHALSKFKRRTLYANIVNDRSAVFYTTGISKTDPFENLDDIKLKYMKGYGDVILDPRDPIAPKEKPPQLPLASRLMTNSQVFIKQLPLTLALAIMIPIGAMTFLIYAGLQTIYSTRRIRLHEAGQAGITIDRYRMPFLAGMRGAAEEVYENLNSAQNKEYLAAGDAEAGPMEPSSFHHDVDSSFKSHSQKELDQPVRLRGSLSDALCETQNDVDVPILALSSDQFAMIKALDDVGWRKYSVHIHNVRHSHAAIIVRSGTKVRDFSEGYAVLRHWLNEEFLIE